MPKMCLDWRVLVGLAALGVGIYVIAAGTIEAAFPILSLAACPLSMLLMMKAMREGPGEDGDDEQPMMVRPAKSNSPGFGRSRRSYLTESAR